MIQMFGQLNNIFVGRLSRKGYIKRLLFTVSFEVVLTFLLYLTAIQFKLFSDADALSVLILAIAVISFLGTFIYLFSLYSRRLHDMGLHGILIWPYFIIVGVLFGPFVYVVIHIGLVVFLIPTLILMIPSGSSGSNKYGPAQI